MYRFWWRKPTRYVYPLAATLKKNLYLGNYRKTIFVIARFVSLSLMMFLVARPQWLDQNSHVDIKGVDIVVALDISGSMQLFDDLNDRRMRISVAQQEAIRFIEKRTNDQIGIVLFAEDAIFRAPLTLDKKFLKNIITESSIGLISPNGTWLGTGLAMAVNRLRDSQAKSKIIILLTDGEPTPEKIDPQVAIELAKQFDVKVYTVGIGNEEGGYYTHPFFGTQRADNKLNTELLQTIAQQTGGKFFRARNPRDMRTIYDTIDALEKTETKAEIFHNYHEAFTSLGWILLVAIGIELLLRYVLWRGISS